MTAADAGLHERLAHLKAEVAALRNERDDARARQTVPTTASESSTAGA